MSAPTPQQLLIEIQSGPLAAELAQYVETVNTFDKDGNVTGQTKAIQCNAIALALGRKDLPGYVTGGDLQKGLLQSGALAHTEFIRTSRLLPSAQDVAPSVPAPYGLIYLSLRLMQAIQFNRRVDVAEISAGADVLIAATLMTADDKAALLAYEQKISRAQVVWGLDASVSADDVTEAMRGA